MVMVMPRLTMIEHLSYHQASGIIPTGTTQMDIGEGKKRMASSRKLGLGHHHITVIETAINGPGHPFPRATAANTREPTPPPYPLEFRPAIGMSAPTQTPTRQPPHPPQLQP